MSRSPLTKHDSTPSDSSNTPHSGLPRSADSPSIICTPQISSNVEIPASFWRAAFPHRIRKSIDDSVNGVSDPACAASHTLW